MSPFTPLIDLAKEHWMYALFCLVFLILISLLFYRRSEMKYLVVPLFTPAEKRFLSSLDKAVSSHYRVFGKVRIADLILPKKGLSKKKWNKHFWQISSKHFDFVLCDKVTFEPIAVVELNDKSHHRSDRVKRDALVKQVCVSAGVPLIWIRARASYSKEVIFSEIMEAIENYSTEF